MFPLQINGVEFGLDNFLGTAYVSGVPDACNFVMEHLRSIRALKCSEKFYPSLGTHRLKCSKGKLVSPGQTIAAGPDTGGISFYATVYSYNQDSGELVFNVYCITNFSAYSNWTILSGIRTEKADYASSITNRLTGATTAQGVAEALRIHNYKNPYILFEDFGHSTFSGSANNGGLEVSGGGQVYYSSVKPNGAVGLSVNSNNERASLYYGNRGFITLLGSGRDTLFECLITMPSSLSNGTFPYTVFAGLKGEGSTEDSPFGVGGIGFKYTHTVNSGNWQAFSANNGSIYTVNGSIGPSADTSYRLRVEVVGSTMTFYVNGTSIGTSSTMPTNHANNLMRPVVTLLAGASVTGSVDLYADYFYFETQGA